MTSTSFAVRIARRIAPPRFILFAVALVIGLVVLMPQLGWARGIMAAFDGAAALFLLTLAPLLGARPGTIRIHARDNDANRALLLGVSVIVTLVILVAVASEIRAKSSTVTVALVVATLALAWLFSNVVFALHYAHLFYLGNDEGSDRGGIDFPGTGEPDYWDFAYFSFTLGMTFQTSDVDISSPMVRRVVLGQSMAAFIFNIGVLAFTINILGSG